MTVVLEQGGKRTPLLCINQRKYPKDITSQEASIIVEEMIKWVKEIVLCNDPQELCDCCKYSSMLLELWLYNTMEKILSLSFSGYILPTDLKSFFKELRAFMFVESFNNEIEKTKELISSFFEKKYADAEDKKQHKQKWKEIAEIWWKHGPDCFWNLFAYYLNLDSI